MESCLVLAVEANGQKITTIEGIAKEGVLSPIRRKFIEHEHDEIINAIEDALAPPKTCPHGNAIPSKSGKVARQAIKGCHTALRCTHDHMCCLACR